MEPSGDRSRGWLRRLLAGVESKDVSPIRSDGSRDAESSVVSERPVSVSTVLTEPIIAYRAWERGSDKTLQSMSRSAIWTPRKRATAQCEKHPRGPGVDCECGIWAFKSVDQLVRSYGHQAVGSAVLGRIALWGVVQKHKDGYRAQYAYPQLFFNVPERYATNDLAAAWGIETAPLPDEQRAVIEPHLESIRKERFHKAWDHAMPSLVFGDRRIPVLDVTEIAARENFRREQAMQPQFSHQRYYGGRQAPLTIL